MTKSRFFGHSRDNEDSSAALREVISFPCRRRLGIFLVIAMNLVLIKNHLAQ